MRIPFFVAAFLVAISSHAVSDDAIRVSLETAKAEYEQSLGEYRKLSLNYLAEREEEARKQGNKKLVDQVTDWKTAFETTSSLPAIAPATLRARPASALRTLTIAYKNAIEEYTRNKQDELASAAQKELAEIKAKSGQPSIAGVWQEGPKENGIRVTITQNGDRFKATCTYRHKSHGEISWRMIGTISKDCEIKGDLVHTKSPKGWLNQTRTGMFSPEDGIISGLAQFQGGSHDFEWKLIEN